MGGRARLQVEAFDGEQPDAACFGRRLHGHRLDERGIGLALFVRDPELADRSVDSDEFVEPFSGLAACG